MQKLLLSCAALLGIACPSASLSAAGATYARAGVAWFSPVDRDSFDAEFGGLVAVGRNFGAHGVEVEIGYVEFSESAPGVTADLELIPLTLGYRYSLPLARKLTLGVGANAGVAFSRLKFSMPAFGSESDEDTVFIASGGLRLQYALTDSVSLGTGYRYVWMDDPEYFGASPGNADIHVIDLGVEFRW